MQEYYTRNPNRWASIRYDAVTEGILHPLVVLLTCLLSCQELYPRAGSRDARHDDPNHVRNWGYLSSRTWWGHKGGFFLQR